MVGVVAAVFTVMLYSFYPLKYKTEIKSAGSLFDVEASLIASVINAESGYHSNAVSGKGAVGLMQIMPDTAAWVASKLAGLSDIPAPLDADTLDADSLKNPEINILIGAYYLKYLLNKFEDKKTALIAYNAGEGNVQTWLSEKEYATAGDDRVVLFTCPYPETNRYVEKVLNGQKFYKHRF